MTAKNHMSAKLEELCYRESKASTGCKDDEHRQQRTSGTRLE